MYYELLNNKIWIKIRPFSKFYSKFRRSKLGPFWRSVILGSVVRGSVGEPLGLLRLLEGQAYSDRLRARPIQTA